MSCREECDRNAVDVEFFAPLASSNVRVEQARAEDPLRLGGADVCARSPSRMVAVCVCNDGAVDRHPRVDVEIARVAVEAVVGGAEEIGHNQKFSRAIVYLRVITCDRPDILHDNDDSLRSDWF